MNSETETLKQFQILISELRKHVREDNCEHSIKQFLEELDFNE